MDGDDGNGDGASVSGHSTDGCDGQLSSTTQPYLRDTISEFRDRVSSFAAQFDFTAVAMEARSKQLRIEEEKAEEVRKELVRKEKELEKALEAAKRKSTEFEAREEAFELLIKKEIAERRKIQEQVEKLKEEIEVGKTEKESVEVKLKELRDRGAELESLGGYLELKAIQVREVEEETEKKQREIEAKEKEISERFEQFRLRERKFEEQLAELRQKEAGFEVRAVELNVKEKEIGERIEQFRSREKNLEEQLAEFRQKQAQFEVRIVELNVKEREVDEKQKQCREVETNKETLSYELMEKKLEEKFHMLSKRIDDLELRRIQDLESKEKQAEITSGKFVSKPKKPATDSLDHSSDANIRLCVIKSGKDLQIFLNEHSVDYDLVKNEVENALKFSSDPAKLVLEAMEGFYPPHLKKGGVEFEEAVVRKNCLMLLEWMTEMSPLIQPTVEKEALEVAIFWKSKMKSDAEHSLEVLAFLQLLAAFELANDFRDEVLTLLDIIAHYRQAPLILRDLDFANKMTSVIQEKLCRAESMAEAAELISAFELNSEFPDVTLPEKKHKEFNLAPTVSAPMSSAKTISSSPESQPLPGRSRGDKRSWSDAFPDGNQAECPGPTQKPERSSRDKVGCSTPISVSSDDSEEEKENSEDSEVESENSEDPEEESENAAEGSLEESENSKGSEEENENSKGSEEEEEDDSLPRTLSFVPQCLELGGTSTEELYKKINYNELRCVEISDVLRRASDPARFVLDVVKNPSSLNLKAGLRSVCLEFPEHGPLILLHYLWRMSPVVKSKFRKEALSFAEDWRSKLAEKIKKDDLDGVSFLLFLAAYKLKSHFEKDKLFSVFGRKNWCVPATKLLVALGLKANIPLRQFFGFLMREKLPLEAVKCIYESQTFEDKIISHRLSSYIQHPPKKQSTSLITQLRDVNRELYVWSEIRKHGLADKTCRSLISKLEKQKATLQAQIRIQ